MADTRWKNAPWIIQKNLDGNIPYERAQLAVLMDIRDELQTLNAVFRCSNFLVIPDILRKIALNTKKKRRVRK